MMKNIRYLIIGVLFGIIMTKSEAISWFRIQEMFRFQSFHMYGIIMSAIVCGILIISLLKKLNSQTVYGEPIVFKSKDKKIKRYLLGGMVFGFGWALTGACPGPLYILLGSGYSVMIVGILSALLGTYAFGRAKEKWPNTFS